MTTNNAQPQKRTTRASANKTKDDAIQAELDELRAQLEALQANAEAEEKASDDDKTTTEASSDDDSEFDVKDTIKEVMDDIPSHFRDLIDSLDESLKDESPTRLLAVFAAGILIGRLLPR
jgi:hypothetical protein